MANIPNDDVLDCIFRACPASSLAVLSLTSSHLRNLALPRLLHTVSFDRKPEEIFTFLNFILANTHSKEVENSDIGSRTEISGPGRYIAELEITRRAFETVIDIGGKTVRVPVKNEENPISTWAPILTRSLALMPNLHSIVIWGHVERIAFHSPNFALALFSCPQLTRMHLYDIGPLASNHFEQALALRRDVMMLETIKLSPDDNRTHKRLELIQGRGMGGVLFHFMAHLTEIGLIECNLNFLHEDASKGGCNTDKTPVSFPKALTLSLHECEVSLNALAGAFPALQTLTLGSSPFSRGIVPLKTRDVPFPCLTSIKGGCRELLTFFEAITVHINLRRIEVDGFWIDRDTKLFTVTRAVPGLKSFHFRVTGYGAMPESWWKALGYTLPCLTFLAMSLPVSSIHELDLILIQIPRSLSCVPLAYLSLSLWGADNVIGDKTKPEIRPLVAEQAIALSYATNIPALKYLDLTKGMTYEEARKSKITSWWSAVRGDSVSCNENGVGVQVNRLDPYEGKVIRNWYDLEA